VFACAAALTASGCLGGGAGTPGPPASIDLEIIWNVPGTIPSDGLGSYFDTPASPHLRPGPVFVAWECTGSGTLRVSPGTARAPHLPPADAPLAFSIQCPTLGPGLVGWSQLPNLAVGGENALSVQGPEASPGFTYRIVVAQPRSP
jgi:hypothetical protein